MPTACNTTSNQAQHLGPQIGLDGPSPARGSSHESLTRSWALRGGAQQEGTSWQANPPEVGSHQTRKPGLHGRLVGCPLFFS